MKMGKQMKKILCCALLLVVLISGCKIIEERDESLFSNWTQNMTDFIKGSICHNESVIIAYRVDEGELITCNYIKSKYGSDIFKQCINESEFKDYCQQGDACWIEISGFYFPDNYLFAKENYSYHEQIRTPIYKTVSRCE